MIHRDLEDAITPWLERDKIIVIKGARQVGKTTLLKQLQAKMEAKGRTVRYLAADLDFADPAFGDPRLFILRLDDLFGGRDGTLLLDEFQVIPRAGLFLKAIYDQTKERYRFIVSGSSSLELGKNAEFLTGRKIEFVARPFSFREFLRAKASEVAERKLDAGEEGEVRDFTALYGSRLAALYAEYLRYGGYPEAVLSPAELRAPLLKELLSTYIRKDVAGFQRVEHAGAFNNLVKLLYSQAGSQVNRSELASTLRLNQETVSRYLDILEGTFVFKLVPPWFTNPRKEVSKMPKVYATDPGIGLAAGLGDQQTRPYDLLEGHRVENAVWSSLAANFGQDSVKYWRSAAGAEIDFIVDTEGGPFPVEAKFTGGAPKTSIAMRNFAASYPDSRRALIVSRDHLSLPSEPRAPRVVPAYLLDFLLPSIAEHE